MNSHSPLSAIANEVAAEYLARATEKVPAFVARFVAAITAAGGTAAITLPRETAWRGAFWGVETVSGSVLVKPWNPPAPNDAFVFPAIAAEVIDPHAIPGAPQIGRGMFACEWNELVELADIAALFIATMAPADDVFRPALHGVGLSRALARRLQGRNSTPRQ
jgi:hypothetical protein